MTVSIPLSRKKVLDFYYLMNVETCRNGALQVCNSPLQRCNVPLQPCKRPLQGCMSHFNVVTAHCKLRTAHCKLAIAHSSLVMACCRVGGANRSLQRLIASCIGSLQGKNGSLQAWNDPLQGCNGSSKVRTSRCDAAISCCKLAMSMEALSFNQHKAPSSPNLLRLRLAVADHCDREAGDLLFPHGGLDILVDLVGLRPGLWNEREQGEDGKREERSAAHRDLLRRQIP